MRSPSSYLTLALLALIVSARTAAGPTALDRTLTTLEEAFRDSRAGKLQEILSADRKVFLSVPAVGEEEGFKGADQVYYLFLRFFEDHPTAGFELDDESARRDDRTASVEADWTYKASGGEREMVLKFTLAAEAGRWILTEIAAKR